MRKKGTSSAFFRTVQASFERIDATLIHIYGELLALEDRVRQLEQCPPAAEGKSRRRGQLFRRSGTLLEYLAAVWGVIAAISLVCLLLHWMALKPGIVFPLVALSLSATLLLLSRLLKQEREGAAFDSMFDFEDDEEDLFL